MAGSSTTGTAERGPVTVLVMAPNLGPDVSYVGDVDPLVEVLDGNGAAADGDPAARSLLAEAEVLLIGYPVPTALAAHAPRLRWAHHTQAGVSNLWRSDLWSSDVPLTSSRGAVTVPAIAEYAVAGIFHFARGLDTAVRQKHEGAFTRRGYALTSVAGATVGVVGLGGIGREVARLARAMGMRVVASRRSVTAPVEDVEGVDLLLPATALHDLLRQSDVVVICSQLTDETRGMFDADAFAAMKPGAVLINIARGEEVDEDALVDAVRSGHLRGALLDVHAGEMAGRPPRPELLELPEILLTPHLSGSGARDGAEPVKALFAENLRRYLADEPLLNLVDRRRGY